MNDSYRWFKLYARMFRDGSPFLYDLEAAGLFCYLLASAATQSSHTAVKHRAGSIPIKLEPGEIVFNQRELSRKFGWGTDKLRARLAWLVKIEVIKLEAKPRYTKARVCNWLKYNRACQQTTTPAADRNDRTAHTSSSRKRRTKERAPEPAGARPGGSPDLESQRMRLLRSAVSRGRNDVAERIRDTRDDELADVLIDCAKALGEF